MDFFFLKTRSRVKWWAALQPRKREKTKQSPHIHIGFVPLVKPIIKRKALLLEVIKQSDESDRRDPSREASPELSNIKKKKKNHNRFIPVSRKHLTGAAAAREHVSNLFPNYLRK